MSPSRLHRQRSLRVIGNQHGPGSNKLNGKGVQSMKRRIWAVVGLLMVAIVGHHFTNGKGKERLGLILAASASPAPSPGCAFPTQMSATPEQTAWQLFVAASCPTTKNQVVWENWIEQSKMYPASG